MIRKKITINPIIPEAGGKLLTIVFVPLIIMAFISGYLWMKVAALEKQIAGNPAVADKQAGEEENNPPATDPGLNLETAKAVDDSDHIRGNKGADVVLVEYSDFECPFCKRFHDVMLQVQKEYGNKAAWVYRQYPLGFHQNAMMESEASECVAELGGNDKFWQYADKLYSGSQSNGTSYDAAQLAKMAGEIGVDQTKFESCLDSGKHKEAIQAEMDNATSAGIQGTPGTIIIAKNGKREFIPGALPFEEVKKLIDGVI